MYRAPTSGFLRIPFVQRCEIGLREEAVAAMTCNLSSLGLYVHVDPPLPPGALVSLRFHLPDGGTPIAVTGMVTWSNDSPPERIVDLPVGCGLRFLEMAPDDRRRVERLVTSYARSPGPIAGLAQPSTGHYRIPYITRCELIGAEAVEDGIVCNLSILGVYVATRADLAVDERLLLAFDLPGLVGPFRRRARVAWANPDLPVAARALPSGYGFEFLDLAVRDRELLAERVAEYLAQLPEPSV